MVIVVDSLDEAASLADARCLRRTVRELAAIGWMRVAVAVRAPAPVDRFRAGSHLHALGVVAGERGDNLVDLDDDRFFAERDVADHALAVLCARPSTDRGRVG